jgi:hypothetical protein
MFPTFFALDLGLGLSFFLGGGWGGTFSVFLVNTTRPLKMSPDLGKMIQNRSLLDSISEGS